MDNATFNDICVDLEKVFSKEALDRFPGPITSVFGKPGYYAGTKDYWSILCNSDGFTTRTVQRQMAELIENQKSLTLNYEVKAYLTAAWRYFVRDNVFTQKLEVHFTITRQHYCDSRKHRSTNVKYIPLENEYQSRGTEQTPIFNGENVQQHQPVSYQNHSVANKEIGLGLFSKNIEQYAHQMMQTQVIPVVMGTARGTIIKSITYGNRLDYHPAMKVWSQLHDRFIGKEIHTFKMIAPSTVVEELLVGIATEVKSSYEPWELQAISWSAVSSSEGVWETSIDLAVTEDNKIPAWTTFIESAPVGTKRPTIVIMTRVPIQNSYDNEKVSLQIIHSCHFPRDTRFVATPSHIITMDKLLTSGASARFQPISNDAKISMKDLFGVDEEQIVYVSMDGDTYYDEKFVASASPYLQIIPHGAVQPAIGPRWSDFPLYVVKNRDHNEGVPISVEFSRDVWNELAVTEGFKLYYPKNIRRGIQLSGNWGMVIQGNPITNAKLTDNVHSFQKGLSTERVNHLVWFCPSGRAFNYPVLFAMDATGREAIDVWINKNLAGSNTPLMYFMYDLGGVQTVSNITTKRLTIKFPDGSDAPIENVLDNFSDMNIYQPVYSEGVKMILLVYETGCEIVLLESLAATFRGKNLITPEINKAQTNYAMQLVPDYTMSNYPFSTLENVAEILELATFNSRGKLLHPDYSRVTFTYQTPPTLNRTLASAGRPTMISDSLLLKNFVTQIENTVGRSLKGVINFTLMTNTAVQPLAHISYNFEYGFFQIFVPQSSVVTEKYKTFPMLGAEGIYATNFEYSETPTGLKATNTSSWSNRVFEDPTATDVYYKGRLTTRRQYIYAVTEEQAGSALAMIGGSILSGILGGVSEGINNALTHQQNLQLQAEQNKAQMERLKESLANANAMQQKQIEAQMQQLQLQLEQNQKQFEANQELQKELLQNKQDFEKAMATGQWDHELEMQAEKLKQDMQKQGIQIDWEKHKQEAQIEWDKNKQQNDLEWQKLQQENNIDWDKQKQENALDWEKDKLGSQLDWEHEKQENALNWDENKQQNQFGHDIDMENLKYDNKMRAAGLTTSSAMRNAPYNTSNFIYSQTYTPDKGDPVKIRAGDSSEPNGTRSLPGNFNGKKNVVDGPPVQAMSEPAKILDDHPNSEFGSERSKTPVGTTNEPLVKDFMKSRVAGLARTAREQETGLLKAGSDVSSFASTPRYMNIDF